MLAVTEKLKNRAIKNYEMINKGVFLRKRFFFKSLAFLFLKLHYYLRSCSQLIYAASK